MKRISRQVTPLPSTAYCDHPGCGFLLNRRADRIGQAAEQHVMALGHAVRVVDRIETVLRPPHLRLVQPAPEPDSWPAIGLLRKIIRQQELTH